MQTYIYADNYRGFSDSIIPIHQVNFLVGENSTGKSSFLDLIEMFSQAPFWVIEPTFGIYETDQKNFLDLVSASSENKEEFTIGIIGISQNPKNPTCGMLITYVNEEWRPEIKRISIIYKNQIRTINGKLWTHNSEEIFSSKIANFRWPKKNTQHAEKIHKFVDSHKSNLNFENLETDPDRARAPLFMRFSDFLFSGKGMPSHNRPPPFPFTRNFYTIAPIRTTPRRTYDAPQTQFSPEGDHIPYVIKKTLATKESAEEFKNFLEEVGSSSRLFQSISINQFGDDPLAPFEMKVVLGSAALGLKNVGYGVSQALPVLVEMFVRPHRTAFTVQQPEVHLHPRAQATFGDVMANLARLEDKVFFVETHSDFTIDRFRLNIRQNGFSKSQILFFERTDSGNFATPIPILENGDLSPEQPSSYRDFFLNESLSLL